MASRGIERVLTKCENSIENGDFYEAHQMIRTVYFRYSAQQKYADAIDLLYHGALTFLNHHQYGSGVDLSLLLVDTLQRSDHSLSNELFDRLVQLLEKMDPDCPERAPYIGKALKWTMSVDHTRGHPDLHQKIGIIFWQEQNYSQARYHYLHSYDGEGCATLLVEYHGCHGYHSEIDLFITQAVLQYLCLRNKTTASDCFKAYTANHPKIESAGPPYMLPLLNFLWFLLIAVESGRIAVFTVLCDKYQPSLERDPTYREYLDKIGQLFFGLAPPRPVSQGLFGDFLQSILGTGTPLREHRHPSPSAVDVATSSASSSQQQAVTWRYNNILDLD